MPTWRHWTRLPPQLLFFEAELESHLDVLLVGFHFPDKSQRHPVRQDECDLGYDDDLARTSERRKHEEDETRKWQRQESVEAPA